MPELNKHVISTPCGHHIAISVPLGVNFGDPGKRQELAKILADGLLAAYETYPPRAEV